MLNNQILPLSQELLFSWLKNFSDQYVTGVVIIDVSKKELPIVYYNETFATLTNYRDDELLGHNLSLLNGSKTNSEIEAELQDHLSHHIANNFTLLHYGKDERIFWNRVTIHPIKDVVGNCLYAFLTCEDYTKEVLNRELSVLERDVYNQFERQTSTETVLETVAQHVEKMFVRQTKCAIQLFNNSTNYALTASGSLPEEIIKNYPINPYNKRTDEQPERIFLQEFEPAFIEAYQFSITTAWSVPIFTTKQKVMGAITLFFENKLTLKEYEIQLIERLAKLISLSTQYLEQKKQLHQLAYYDKATSIPNAYYFNKVLQQWIDEGFTGFIAIIQPGEYSNIVDLYGRHAGDELLSQMVTRLQQSASVNSEFVAKFTHSSLIIARKAKIENLDRYNSRVKPLTTIPYLLREQEVYLTLKIGVSYFGPNLTAEQCVREADLALTKARGISGTNTAYYEETITTQIQQEMDTLNQLTYGLEHNEFFVHLQPKVNFNTLTIEGFEALSRWHSHVLGTVSPAIFIPIAEQAGKIQEIDTLVLRQVLQWQHYRLSNQLKTVPIAVNISPDHFYDSHFLQNFLELLHFYHVPPEYIKLEVTESIELVDFKKAKSILVSLKQHGIESSIDDFGVGFSSLSYLPQLPFSEIKIDRSFVNSMGDTGMLAVVQTIIQLANNLQMHAIAEGIETSDQFEKLLAMGCSSGQGYYFYKPMSLDAAASLMNESL